MMWSADSDLSRKARNQNAWSAFFAVMSNWMVYAHTTVLDLRRFVEVLSGGGTQEIMQTEQVETWIGQNTLKNCSAYNFGEFALGIGAGIMQRSSGVVPSALKPPRPPSKNKTVPMATIIQKDSCFVDEKGDKMVWWMSNAETAVHLVPVVLLTCILILYICSSAQFLGEFAG